MLYYIIYSISSIDGQQLALEDKYEELKLKLKQSVMTQKDLDMRYVVITVFHYHLCMYVCTYVHVHVCTLYSQFKVLYSSLRMCLYVTVLI